MKATKIRMKTGCYYSNNLLEISQIYIDDCGTPGWFDKAIIHDFLNQNPGSIRVNIYPYPVLVPAKSVYGEKYVKSQANNSTIDNLLNLPRV